MTIDVTHIGDVVVLGCTGSLDAETIARFKQTTQKLVEAGHRRLVMNAAALQFVDSMGLGAMISLLRRLKEKGGDL